MFPAAGIFLTPSVFIIASHRHSITVLDQQQQYWQRYSLCGTGHSLAHEEPKSPRWSAWSVVPMNILPRLSTGQPSDVPMISGASLLALGRRNFQDQPFILTDTRVSILPEKAFSSHPERESTNNITRHFHVPDEKGSLFF